MGFHGAYALVSLPQTQGPSAEPRGGMACPPRALPLLGLGRHPCGLHARVQREDVPYVAASYDGGHEVEALVADADARALPTRAEL